MSELREIIDDILALHAEEDEIKVSKKARYADAQDAGINKSALGLAIRTIRARQKQETPAALEKQSEADRIIAEYDRPSHVHVREAAETPSGAEAGRAVRSSAPTPNHSLAEV
jgi:uncharacterized protein (UPF0335 family)